MDMSIFWNSMVVPCCCSAMACLIASRRSLSVNRVGGAFLSAPAEVPLPTALSLSLFFDFFFFFGFSTFSAPSSASLSDFLAFFFFFGFSSPSPVDVFFFFFFDGSSVSLALFSLSSFASSLVLDWSSYVRYTHTPIPQHPPFCAF